MIPTATGTDPAHVTALPGIPTEADLVAAAVLACPAVAGLHGGRFGEVATYLPGRRITGVRMSPDPASPVVLSTRPTTVELHVVARYPLSLVDLDTAVRASVRTALALRTGPVTVSIRVEDVVDDRATDLPTDLELEPPWS